MMPESMITKFYESLAKGEIYGSECQKCKYLAFPPKAGCANCGAHNMKLKKVSVEGEVLFFSSGNLPPMKFAKYHPYAYGAVRLKEGPVFYTQIQGVDVSNVKVIEEQNKKMPLKAKAKIVNMADMNIVVFEVAK